METEQEKQLWKIAKKRVGFKRHLATYIIINSMLWVLWSFDKSEDNGELPWPLWSMLGWGVGLAFSFLGAYVFTKEDAIQKEFEKLKNK